MVAEAVRTGSDRERGRAWIRHSSWPYAEGERDKLLRMEDQFAQPWSLPKRIGVKAVSNAVPAVRGAGLKRRGTSLGLSFSLFLGQQRRWVKPN